MKYADYIEREAEDQRREELQEAKDRYLPRTQEVNAADRIEQGYWRTMHQTWGMAPEEVR